MNIAATWRAALPHASLGLLICTGIGIWIGPTVWLHDRQHQTIMEVKTDLSGEIGELREEIGEVRAAVQDNAVSIARLEATVQQIADHLVGAQP